MKTVFITGANRGGISLLMFYKVFNKALQEDCRFSGLPVSRFTAIKVKFLNIFSRQTGQRAQPANLYYTWVRNFSSTGCGLR